MNAPPRLVLDALSDQINKSYLAADRVKGARRAVLTLAGVTPLIYIHQMGHTLFLGTQTPQNIFSFSFYGNYFVFIKLLWASVSITCYISQCFF